MNTISVLRLLCVLGWAIIADVAVAVASEPVIPANASKPSDASGDDEVSEPTAAKSDPAADKYWAALKLFRSKAPDDLAAGRAALQEAAAGEYPQAQLFLGECFELGSYGFTQNKKKAAAYFRLAAERDNAFAKVSYGICLFAGIGVRKDESTAAEWLTAALTETADYSQPSPPADFQAGTNLQAAADEGVAGGVGPIDAVASAKARAHYFLGVMQESRKKFAEAQSHYLTAATAGAEGRAGIQQAAMQAALNYAFGNGVARDMAKATEMLDLARTLGRRSGISVIHNYANAKLVDDFAVADLEEAVAKGSEEETSDLQIKIAQQFTDRKSKQYNPQEAEKWFELAAESGKPWAMLELALLYSRGDLAKPELAFKWFERVGGGDKPKHLLGVANLVICHQNGFGTPADPAKARELAAGFRNDEFVCHLLFLGQCPASVLTYEEALALNLHWAEKLKDPQAQYFLGVRYLNGWGLAADAKKAAAWFKKASKTGNGPACRALGYLYQSQPRLLGVDRAEGFKRAAELYRRGADAGDVWAATNLGYLYGAGLGVRRDSGQAMKLYEKAIEMEPKATLAINNLGGIYHDMFITAARDREEASAKWYREKMLALYERADALGSEYAADNLGRLHYSGALGKRDFQKAYEFFEKAAERGFRDARFQLAEMHEKGEGVPVSYAEAAYHYRLAALDGNIAACRRLVEFYLEGKGGIQDFERAMFWLARLAQSGDTRALTKMADVALKQQKYADAIKLLKPLRNSPSRTLSGFAYERLASCYRNGWGVAKDAERAKTYVEKAASLGNGDAFLRIANAAMAAGNEAEAIRLFREAAADTPAACYALGQMHYFGQHLPKDLTKALTYLRGAAKDKNSDAMYFLASMTATRAEGAPALEEAIRFAQSAEGLGHPKAAVLRERLEQLRKQQGSASEQTTQVRST